MTGTTQGTTLPPIADAREAAAELLAANRRRRRVRRWLLLALLPVTLVGLLFVGKLLSMYAFAHQAISAYVVDDYAGSEAAAHGQEFLNWFEPYKAPFNVGTARAGAEQLPEARADLEEALDLARGLEVCGVRINLALVIERMGDAAREAGDGAGAAQLYGEALTVVIETPEECDSDQAQDQSSDPNRDMSDTLDESEDRLKQKQQQEKQEQQPDDAEQQEQQQPQPDDQKLEDLKDKLDQGTQERDQQQDGDDPGGSGTEKPW
ncbi:tetratricopeptide repeat protein [Microbacterium sp. 179-I 3D4 NHS]|uniref:tetratricopeptide repeat protein n=1 Tax=Microbacterium sp. 179-I 3D4 NHS TaxID=3142381 RepID=UPI0039A11470